VLSYDYWRLTLHPYTPLHPLHPLIPPYTPLHSLTLLTPPLDDVALLQLASGFAGCELMRRVLGSGAARGAARGAGDALDDAPGAPLPERWPMRARKVAIPPLRYTLLATTHP
jgi:hypothetical protein